MARWLGFLLFVCATASSAQAQGLRRPALHWSRSEQASNCIDPHALALRVTALTGPVLVEPAEAEVSIEGHIERLPNGTFEARITATGNDGTPRGARTLRQQGGDCRALDAALAFVVALLIDPDLALERMPASLVALGAEGPAPEQTLLAELERTPPKPVVLAAPKEPAAAARPAVEKPPPAARRALSWELLLGPALSLREFPSVALGAFANIALVPRPWLALELQLRALSMLKAVSFDERSVRAMSFSGAALVCPRYAAERFFVEGCGGPDISMFRARGQNFEQDKTAFLPGYAVALAAGIGVRIRQAWLLRARSTLRILLNEPSFDYASGDASDTALELGRYAVGVNLGAGYRF
jgi:hypothetical protein